MTENHESGVLRTRVVVFVAAAVLAIITKMLLPEVSGTRLAAGWITLTGEALSMAIITVGYYIGIKHAVRRGGYSA